MDGYRGAPVPRGSFDEAGCVLPKFAFFRIRSHSETGSSNSSIACIVAVPVCEPFLACVANLPDIDMGKAKYSVRPWLAGHNSGRKLSVPGVVGMESSWQPGKWLHDFIAIALIDRRRKRNRLSGQNPTQCGVS
jgi:hypothetical protein